MTLYDISPPISPALAVWPGDARVSIEFPWAIAKGAPVNVSTLTLSAHTGSHVDAPFHFDARGATVDQLPLEPFVGPALLVDVTGAATVGLEAIAGLEGAPPERLLVRTRARTDPSRFDPRYPPLLPRAAERLVEMGVRLYGTDAPSIDPFESESIESHRILGRGGVMILEGLCLDEPPAGRYELFALPLRIVGGDGSPVRALLRATVV